MMRRLSCLCALTITLGLTPLRSSAQEDLPLETTRLEWPARIATPAGRVRVTITKTKHKLYPVKQQRPLYQLVLEDDDTDYYDELPDIYVGRGRPELVDQTVDLELPDAIKIRLALARLKAMKRYEETWT